MLTANQKIRGARERLQVILMLTDRSDPDVTKKRETHKAITREVMAIDRILSSLEHNTVCPLKAMCPMANTSRENQAAADAAPVTDEKRGE